MSEATSLIRDQAALSEVDSLPLGLDEYQSFTETTDRSPTPGLGGLGFLLLGLFGEVGSLLSEIKKKRRDKDTYLGYRAAVVEELGDALWYFATISLRAGILLSDIARRVPAGLADWDYHGHAEATTFRHLQKETTGSNTALQDDQIERRLLTLAGFVGEFVQNYNSGRFDSNRDALSADLVEIFRAMIAAADDADVSLNEAAEANIVKSLGRWPTKRVWGGFYDQQFEKDEQLPRRIEMRLREKIIGDKTYVVQQCNGINIGDRLTDNRVEQDDYRFHDVFHLAYAAILGWSPVIRALFKVKRKSMPEVDENQDGARASVIEEAISAMVFNHGLKTEYLRNAESVDYSALKAVRDLVSGYEVETRPLWQWEKAILDGFSVFRELRKYRKGVVTADLAAHTITYAPWEEEA